MTQKVVDFKFTNGWSQVELECYRLVRTSRKTGRSTVKMFVNGELVTDKAKYDWYCRG